MFYRALAHTLVAAATAIAIAASGLLDGATVEVGLEHYAERPLWYSPPGWLAMPANTLVNAGYVVVGVAWAARARAAERAGILRAADAYMFYVFAIAAALYGPVQTTRLLARSRAAAALDQWVTLPIFAWVVPWAAHVDGGGGGGGAGERMGLAVVVASAASYVLALASPVGFEAALCVHVVAAVAAGALVQHRRGNAASLAAMRRAVVCCAGFVVLKLLDHELAAQHAVFRHVSGHFLSKVCDFMQIHYVCEFFWRLEERRRRTEKVE